MRPAFPKKCERASKLKTLTVHFCVNCSTTDQAAGWAGRLQHSQIEILVDFPDVVLTSQFLTGFLSMTASIVRAEKPWLIPHPSENPDMRQNVIDPSTR